MAADSTTALAEVMVADTPLLDPDAPATPAGVELGTPVPGTVQPPRWLAKINGDVWSEIVHIEVEQRSYNVVGTFTIDAIFSDAGEVQGSGNVAAGSRLDKLLTPSVPPKRVPVEILAGYPANPHAPFESQLTSIFNGFVDKVFIDRKKDLVTISGRDKSAVFTESFIHTQLRNISTLSAVAEIAARHEMALNAENSGSTLGAIYDYDQIALIATGPQGLNEWTLLTRFAAFDGYAVFVSTEPGIGDVLNYLPFERYEKIITFKWGFNLDDLELEKTYSFNSSRVGIELLSTQTKRKENVKATAGAVRGGGDALIYRYVLGANIDADTAGFAAELLALFHAQLEFIITAHTVGNPNQTLFNRLRLVNATPSFDRDYRIIRINWTFGLDVGWKAELTAVAAPAPDVIRQARKRRSLRLTASRH